MVLFYIRHTRNLL